MVVMKVMQVDVLLIVTLILAKLTFSNFVKTLIVTKNCFSPLGFACYKHAEKLVVDKDGQIEEENADNVRQIRESHIARIELVKAQFTMVCSGFGQNLIYSFMGPLADNQHFPDESIPQLRDFMI